MAGVELGKSLLQLLLLLPRGRVQETISPTFFIITFEGTRVPVLEVVAVVVEAVERVGGQGGQEVEASGPEDALADVLAVERQVEDVLETVIWYLKKTERMTLKLIRQIGSFGSLEAIEERKQVCPK